MPLNKFERLCELCGDELCANVGKRLTVSHCQLYKENDTTEVLPSYEFAGYDEIIRMIKNAPMTYLPAILMNTVENCIERKIFKDGDTLVEAVSKIVKKNEA